MMVSADDLTKRLFAFMEDAGRYALSKKENARRELKPDKTIVTEADLHITKMFYEHFASEITSAKHLILDEETVSQNQGQPINDITDYDLVWSLDPIDGTIFFTTGIPMWAISLGIFKDQKPWLGMIYFPELGELLYNDDNHAYLVKNPFTATQSTKRLNDLTNFEHLDMPILLTSGRHLAKDAYRHFSPLNFYTTVAHVSIVIKGAAIGSLEGSRICLWDIAGVWPILQKVGLGMFDYETGRPIVTFDPTEYTEKWYTGRRKIICRAQDFDRIKSVFDIDETFYY